MSVKLVDQIREAAEPILTEAGYELADLELVKEGANWYLRFFIDKEEGIDIDDCERASNLLSDWLDETDPIPQAYFLEVSSPGIERPLKKEKDFLRFAGKKVTVRLFAPVKGEKVYVGELGPVNEEVLCLTLEDGSLCRLPREKISQINLYWDENEGGMSGNE